MAQPAFKANADYFDAIEAAILETPRGRWFLSEYAKRASLSDTNRVLNAITELKNKLSADLNATHIEILRRELQEMSHSIVQTRQEIAAIKPADAGNNRIMAATEELDAIVTATERATSDILTAAERLLEMSGEMTGLAGAEPFVEELSTLSTNILMACSFQDITGQRTTKVVNVLRYLEQRVNTMIEIWGIDGIQGAPLAMAKPDDKRPDAHLLSGPQLEGAGVSQDDIDAMMSDDAHTETVVAKMQKKAEDAMAQKAEREQAAPAKEKADPSPDLGGGGGEAIDQDAIDALFD